MKHKNTKITTNEWLLFYSHLSNNKKIDKGDLQGIIKKLQDNEFADYENERYREDQYFSGLKFTQAGRNEFRKVFIKINGIKRNLALMISETNQLHGANGVNKYIFWEYGDKAPKHEEIINAGIDYCIENGLIIYLGRNKYSPSNKGLAFANDTLSVNLKDYLYLIRMNPFVYLYSMISGAILWEIAKKIYSYLSQ